MRMVIDTEIIKDRIEHEWGYEGIRDDLDEIFENHGTLIPKGNGRLIDADNMKRIDAIQMGDFNSIESIRKWIDIMPTVIEADKEVENEGNR